MRTRSLAFLLGLGLLAAGCGSGGGGSASGGSGSSGGRPYTAAATAPCLTQQGFTGVTTRPADVGLVAAFADNGGLKATAPDGATVTIAFAKDSDAVAGTEDVFRKHASMRYRNHMQDIMSVANNAVLVWSQAPAQQQHDLVIGCLHHS